MPNDPRGKPDATWPGNALLLLCVAIVAAGYGVALWRGPEPSSAVTVTVVEAPPSPQ